jgi:hypothetical protein
MISGEENAAGQECGRLKLRNDNFEKEVIIIHSKIDQWVAFYEAKCEIDLKGLSSFDDQSSGKDVIKTYFVLCLLQVDTISTIIVEAKPLLSNGKIILSKNNLDILKSAAKKIPSIFQHSLTSPTIKISKYWPIDQIILKRSSKIRVAHHQFCCASSFLTIRLLHFQLFLLTSLPNCIKVFSPAGLNAIPVSVG